MTARTTPLALLVLTPLFVLALCWQAHAHTLYFTLHDAGDGMVELEGLFSNGALASRTTVKIYDKADGSLLWQGRTDDFGTCTFERPEVPYEVEVDAGPGHKARGAGI
ncbi:hypothetical protein GKC30_06080 [Pseudodesulfovibrio sp. F-1]|uniref:DUF4198 domain-containing protein n=1 Tax=Pseudodesulfovibrio alkaliphilus TaxID=2661613 RepID=A0A7K1KMF6_9BACT|nr:hypothetical protein [Pseudodesulfovibrio alkaliphilus]MUM77197.1 hypothetical protein [Pseudodesulfovibrio alkaliphilus]